MPRPFGALIERKIGDITREYERRQLVGFPVTLDGVAETLQVARDVDRTNWLTVYGICLEGMAAGAGDVPAAIFLQTTSNRRYEMTLNEAAAIIRDLRTWGLAAWANWNALKERARTAGRREDLELIDITEGYP